MTTLDTFANFTGFRDALMKGVAIVFVPPLLAAVTMTAIYRMPRTRSRWLIGGGLVAAGMLISIFSARWAYQFVSDAVDTALLATGLMILWLGMIVMLIGIPDWDYWPYSISVVLMIWFYACYQAGASWHFVDIDFHRQDFTYMKTEAGECLKRRLIRTIDAGVLVLGDRPGGWELWPKGKITYFSSEDACQQTSTNR